MFRKLTKKKNRQNHRNLPADNDELYTAYEPDSNSFSLKCEDGK